MKPFYFVFILSFLSILCSASLLPEKAEVTMTQGDGRIGTYVSSWKGFRTSSYWIEGPDGLILIDTQFLPSASEEMLNWAEKVTAKKAKLAIILHPNPDKFNGTELFQKRGIRVVTSSQVLSLIPAVHKLRTSWFFESFKPDYPTEVPKPESFGDKTTELKAAGLTVKAHVLGKGCSDAHVVVQFEDNVFVGDLATIGFHSWLELGQPEEWLKRIEEINAMEPTYVRTGRGGSGDADVLTRESEYLNTVIRTFKSFHPKKGKALKKSDSEKIVKTILQKYPSYDYPNFIENGVAEVWKSLSK